MLRNEKGEIEIIMGVITLAIVIVLIGGTIWWNYQITYGTVQTAEITVKDKYIKRGAGKNDKDKYLVVDTDKNTYEITDLTFIGKWNSTDLYNELEIGKKYKITTSGIRNQFLSMYPNINKIEETKN